MKKYFNKIGLFLLIFVCSSCSGTQQLVWCPPITQEYPAPEWEYQEDAVRIHVQADPKLNFYRGDAHTLNLCIYQLKEPNAFNQMVDIGDIDELLGKGYQFTDGSRTNFQSKTIKPGQDLVFTFDRAKGTKYLGIVAGYFASLEKEKVVSLIDFDVLVSEKKIGWLKRIKVSKPDILDLDLILGPEQITKMKINRTKCESDKKRYGRPCLF